MSTQKLTEQRITVVRHGETEWSRTGQHTGRSNIPLTEGGEEDARRLGEWLRDQHFDHIFTSPLRRAADTCRLAGFADVAETRDELMEWDYGEYEGRTSDDIVDEQPEWQIWTHGSEEGESVEQMQTRVQGVCDELLELEGRILIFAHGHFLRALAAAWIQLSVTEGRRMLLDTGAIGELGWYHRRRALARWNFTPST